MISIVAVSMAFGLPLALIVASDHGALTGVAAWTGFTCFGTLLGAAALFVRRSDK